MIREASEADLARLQAIGRTTYIQHFAPLWTQAGLEQFLAADFADVPLAKSLRNRDRVLWLLVEDEETLIGFAKINWQSAMPIGNGVGAELQKIYFSEKAVGAGHGRSLMEQIFHHCRNRGEKRLWLDVLKSNHRAQRFYHSFGFSIVGEIPFKTDRVDVGMFVMSVDL